MLPDCLHPGQPQTPQGRARVDVVEFADGRIELLYRGVVLRHRRFEVNAHLRASRIADDKTLNERVDRLVSAEQTRLARLSAQIHHQEAQRTQGVFVQDHPAAPLCLPVLLHNPGTNPISKGDISISIWEKRGHFYFGLTSRSRALDDI